MELIFNAILEWFVILCSTVNDVDFIYGYSLLSFLVACVTLLLLWKLINLFLGVIGSMGRSGARTARNVALRRMRKAR